MSLDALRGFDMFVIIGGDWLVRSLADLTGWTLAIWGKTQMKHVEWDGFVFYDMIFPLFLFIAGVAMPFSLIRRLEQGEDKHKLVYHIVRRGLILVVLGLVYNNGLFYSSIADTRFPSVLSRIGLAYMFAGLIVLNTKLRAQVIWFVGLLLGYWAAMMWIPVPGFGAGQLTVEGSLAGYIDRMVLPGRLARGVHDPEGLLSTIPAISTALLGVFAGTLLRRDFPDVTGERKALILAGAGVAALALGSLWDFAFPINKNLWSSSFVLFAGGWSLLLLALFYLVIDVWGYTRWALFFIVIGMNSILIYMAGGFIDFAYTTDALFKGLLARLGVPGRGVLWWTGLVLIKWVFLYFLYRQKIFLRI